MSHIILLCAPATGHINSLGSVGRELQARGHRVSMPNIVDMEEAVARVGAEYFRVAEKEFPKGWFPEFEAKMGVLSGYKLIRHTLEALKLIVGAWSCSVPALRDRRPDLLIVDSFLYFGSSVAEYLDRPYVTLCSTLAMIPEPTIPPGVTAWPYSPSLPAVLRNLLGYALGNFLAIRPVLKAVNEWRTEWRLKPLKRLTECYSRLATVAQQPAVFDYPRRRQPEWFHYAGPFHDARIRPPVSFPFEKLDGRALIYASMGTVVNRLKWVFREIARACDGLNAQLVISLGGGADPAEIGALPGNPLVVRFAPQLDVLARSALAITHAGLNTTLESLSQGVPMVAIPVGNDGMGSAARVKWTGIGEMLPIKRLRADRLRPLVASVLTQPHYRAQAARLGEEIRRVDGVRLAADIVERVLVTGGPVTREEVGQFRTNAVAARARTV